VTATAPPPTTAPLIRRGGRRDAAGGLRREAAIFTFGIDRADLRPARGRRRGRGPVGVEALYYTRELGPSGDDFTGLIAIPAGLLLLGLGDAAPAARASSVPAARGPIGRRSSENPRAASQARSRHDSVAGREARISSLSSASAEGWVFGTALGRLIARVILR